MWLFCIGTWQLVKSPVQEMSENGKEVLAQQSWLHPRQTFATWRNSNRGRKINRILTGAFAPLYCENSHVLVDTNNWRSRNFFHLCYIWHTMLNKISWPIPQIFRHHRIVLSVAFMAANIFFYIPTNGIETVHKKLLLPVYSIASTAWGLILCLDVSCTVLYLLYLSGRNSSTRDVSMPLSVLSRWTDRKLLLKCLFCLSTPLFVWKNTLASALR
jgi:hypothetical protein